tara:strand:- start:689 stop:910 length:222 start_codon:yes stop_codon:yes gene_type:complete
MESFGKQLIIYAFVLLFFGFLIILFSKIPWFGTTFLDYTYTGKKNKIYVPFGSMAIISIVLTILANFFLRFFK